MTGRRAPLAERLWRRVDATGDCWTWTGYLAKTGYGQIADKPGPMAYTHRVAWESLVGPIPDGMQLDHLCRNRACVNPDHLEQVASAVNTLRGHGPSARAARRQTCAQGHPYSDENTYRHPKQRMCRVCRRERDRAYYRRAVVLHETPTAPVPMAGEQEPMFR